MDEIPLSVLFATLALLIFLSAFFSASEIGMMALNRYRLKHMAESGHRAARLVSRLLQHPDRLLGIILLGNNLVNIFAATVATIIALRLYGQAALAIVPLLLTLVILIFAEVAPKTLAVSHPERIAFPAAFILQPLLKVFYYPLVWPVNLIANLLLRPFGGSVHGASHELSSEELRAAVMEAGTLIPEAHQSMLLGILDLEKLTIEDVMIPRGQIAGIDLDADWDDIVGQITDSSFTRLPVYRGSLDNVVGIVHVRKVLNLMRSGKLDHESLEKIIVEPYFIPEGTPLNTQLLNFRAAKRRHGLVVDEYGDILGLVTLEEILEEIIGDFTTPGAAVLGEIQADADGSYLIKGTTSIRDLNRKLNWDLPTKGSRTVNGLITEYLEDLPSPGTSLLLGSYLLEIVRTRGTAVQVVRIQRREE